jgi:hypothetical protein
MMRTRLCISFHSTDRTVPHRTLARVAALPIPDGCLQKQRRGEDDVALDAFDALLELLLELGVADDLGRGRELPQHLFQAPQRANQRALVDLRNDVKWKWSITIGG